MSGIAGGFKRCPDQKRPAPASSCHASSPSCCSPQTWLPIKSPLQPPQVGDHQTEQDSQDCDAAIQLNAPSRFYEELFCTSQTSNLLAPLAPLAGTLVTSSRPQSDVVKQGHLGKLERSHLRYFVLRAGSHTGPSRLEWYKSQEKFTAMETSAGKAALFGSSKQGVIYLRCCLGVSRIGSSRKGHTVALYAKDQTMVLAVQDQQEQEDWYLAIKKLMEEERRDEEYGEGLDEEDDGYCTLPPAAFFKEVWPVTVKPRGLGCSKSLAGESRLCLTATSLILVRVSACSDLPSITIPLLSVRRFGHLDGSFFLELGRSAPNGPGEIWMKARDQGNSAGAQNIHEEVRETVRALRVLSDFSQSPTSSQNQLQTLLASKRCRPKYRDKFMNVRPLGSRLALPPRNPEVQSPKKCYVEPDNSELESTLSSSHGALTGSEVSETDSYSEEKMAHHLPLNDCRRTSMVTGDHCSAAACTMEGWEPEDEEEGLGYMMMSPQVNHSLSVLPQDDYVTMASPHKHDWPSSPCPTLQTSFNSSASDGNSPLHPSHHQTGGHSQPQDDSGHLQRRLPAHTRAMSTPKRHDDSSGTTHPSGPGQSLRRSRLSLCLPSCLQAEDVS